MCIVFSLPREDKKPVKLLFSHHFNFFYLPLYGIYNFLMFLSCCFNIDVYILIAKFCSTFKMQRLPESLANLAITVNISDDSDLKYEIIWSMPLIFVCFLRSSLFGYLFNDIHRLLLNYSPDHIDYCALFMFEMHVVFFFSRRIMA